MSYNIYDVWEITKQRIEDAWESAHKEDERSEEKTGKALVTFEFNVNTWQKHKVECEVDHETADAIQSKNLDATNIIDCFKNEPEVLNFLEDCDRPFPHDLLFTDPHVETMLEVISITDHEGGAA